MSIAKLEDDFLAPFTLEYTELLKDRRETVTAMSKDELLLSYYSYYHYFNGNPDEIANLQAGIVYDKSTISGQSFWVFRVSKEDIDNIEDEADKNTVDILIPCWHNGDITPSAFASPLAKMLDDVDLPNFTPESLSTRFIPFYVNGK